MIDARRLRTPTNADEALAMFVSYSTPGDVISMHTDWCRLQLSDEADCTCTPVTMTMGATA